jgi:hypothetical protein
LGGASLYAVAARKLIVDGAAGTRIIQLRSKATGRPIFRLDRGPVPNKGVRYHYHRRPDLKKHRPYEGGL